MNDSMYFFWVAHGPIMGTSSAHMTAYEQFAMSYSLVLYQTAHVNPECVWHFIVPISMGVVTQISYISHWQEASKYCEINFQPRSCAVTEPQPPFMVCSLVGTCVLHLFDEKQLDSFTIVVL